MYTRAHPARVGKAAARHPASTIPDQVVRVCADSVTILRAGASGCDAVVKPATARIRRMRRTLAAGIELDDDPSRVDIDAVHDFLANHSYWAEGRDRDTVERLVNESQRVVGIYEGHRQIGFARAFTDDASVAYLADVYVLPQYRGRGFGVELVRETIESGPYARRRWLLHTKDAHDLYRRFGFGEPSERVMERRPR